MDIYKLAKKSPEYFIRKVKEKAVNEDKTLIQAWEEVEELYFSKYGEYRFSEYGSFRVAYSRLRKKI